MENGFEAMISGRVSESEVVRKLHHEFNVLLVGLAMGVVAASRFGYRCLDIAQRQQGSSGS
jgi:hypothetical protein